MKTNLIFEDVLPFACIIVPAPIVKDVRELITATTTVILETYTPEQRKDDNYCFNVEKLPKFLFESLKETLSIPTYTIGLFNDMVAEFVEDKENRVKDIRISFKSNNRIYDIINVRSRKQSLLAKEISHYEVDWSSIGSSDIALAEQFSIGIKYAVVLAQNCTEQFVK